MVIHRGKLRVVSDARGGAAQSADGLYIYRWSSRTTFTALLRRFNGVKEKTRRYKLRRSESHWSMNQSIFVVLVLALAFLFCEGGKSFFSVIFNFLSNKMFFL